MQGPEDSPYEVKFEKLKFKGWRFSIRIVLDRQLPNATSKSKEKKF
jgi:hypothetical protein